MEDSAGKLLPNQLTVDNLTIECLRNKLSELEASIKENQEKRAQLSQQGHENIFNNKSNHNNESSNNG